MMNMDTQARMYFYILCTCVMRHASTTELLSYTEDLQMNNSYARLVEDIVDDNEDIPIECVDIKHDICWSEETSDDWYGSYAWPNTSLGHRSLLQCEYSQHLASPVFVSRDCVLIETWSSWVPPDYAACPGRPLPIALARAENIIYTLEANESYVTVGIMDDLSNILETYGDQFTIYSNDTDALFRVWISAMDSYGTAGTPLNRTMASDMLRICDYLLYNYYSKDKFQLANSLVLLPSLLSTMAVGESPWRENMSSVVLDLEESSGGVTQFEGYTYNYIEPWPYDVTLHSNDPVPDGQPAALLIFHKERLPESIIVTDDEAEFESEPDEEDFYLFSPLAPDQDSLEENLDMNGTDDPFPDEEGRGNGSDTWTGNAANDPDDQVYVYNVGLGGDSFDWELNPVLYSLHSFSNARGSDLRVDYAVDSPETPICVKWTAPITDRGFDFNLSQPCTVLHPDFVNYQHYRCQCNVTPNAIYGAFTVKAYSAKESYRDFPRYMDFDLSDFLHFPYNRPVYILGQVLQALSLTCLVLTVLSYAIFRKARRGLLTTILLNLCAALISMIVVLYVTVAMTSSKTGCRAANILRTFFILVSLMWNAVEANNMYRMLIKVWNANTDYYIYKAAAMAWGAPVLPIAIALIVDIKSFDGRYIDCIFRCSERPMTLYLTLYLPLVIIVLHNIVVFILVVRVILNRGAVGESAGSRRNRLVQLYGCFTMLVLLGTPWVFSLFGAIDGDMNQDLKILEGVMQTVFIITLNLQGIFIFIFHCVRIPEMRTQWRTSVTKLSLSSTASSTDGVKPSTDTSSRKLHTASTSQNSLGNDDIISTKI